VSAARGSGVAGRPLAPGAPGGCLGPRRPGRLGGKPADGAPVVGALDPRLEVDDGQVGPLHAGERQQLANPRDVLFIQPLVLVSGSRLGNQLIQHVIHAPTIGASATERKTLRMRAITMRVATGIRISFRTTRRMTCIMR